MVVYYFVPFIVSNRYLLFRVSNVHNSVTVQNRTHVYMNFFDYKDLGNHPLQLCPKVVKHPVYLLPLYAFVAWTGSSLPSCSHSWNLYPSLRLFMYSLLAFQSFLRPVSYLPILLLPFLFIPSFLSFLLFVQSFFFVVFFLSFWLSLPSIFCPSFKGA